MMEDRFKELTSSSKNALAWALTRARYRASSLADSAHLVTGADSVDLLVGLFLVHGQDSEPIQLLRHFAISPDQLYSQLKSAGGFAPDNAPSAPEPLNEMSPLTDEVEKILNESFSLSDQFNPESDHLVRVRDLFGGLLRTPAQARDLLQKSLASAGVPFDDIAGIYPEFLRSHSDEMPFSKFLAERFPSHAPQASAPQQSPPEPVQVSPQLRFAVSGFSADTRTERDLIGIGAEVDAFAYLIAAKALQPPMAIGLFGD